VRDYVLIAVLAVTYLFFTACTNVDRSTPVATLGTYNAEACKAAEQSYQWNNIDREQYEKLMELYCCNCDSRLKELRRGMTKAEVKEIYGSALHSGHTNDGFFYWIVLPKTGTERVSHARRLEYKYKLQLFWGRNDKLIGYREIYNDKPANTVIFR
jgi:hypothetical protein